MQRFVSELLAFLSFRVKDLRDTLCFCPLSDDAFQARASLKIIVCFACLAACPPSSDFYHIQKARVEVAFRHK